MNKDERIISTEKVSSDKNVEGIRPTTLDGFIGQEKLRGHLEIMVEAAKGRGEAIDHILFAGPPGLGKTTLANIVAKEMGGNLHTTSGPAIDRPGELVSTLTNMKPNDVLFVDEIHRLPKTVEEIMYPAMEDNKIDIVLGVGSEAKTLRIDVPPFTVVGATTRTGMLTGPLRDRFGFIGQLNYYTVEELQQIVARSANVHGVTITDQATQIIAKGSRGTPRVANRLLRRVRDYVEVKKDGTIDEISAREGMEVFGVDERGLDAIDRKILSTICEKFGGGPVGLSTLSAATSEPAETLEDVLEPYLISEGFLTKTPKGRVVTDSTWDHLGISRP